MREVTIEEKTDYLEYLWCCACIFGDGDSDYDTFKNTLKTCYGDIENMSMSEFITLTDDIKALVLTFPLDQFSSSYDQIYDDSYYSDRVDELKA